jgi:hypothetical protein
MKGGKNMKNKIITLGMTGLVLGGLLFIAPGSTLAYRGDVNVKGPNYTAERHETMLKLFETKNFGGWLKEMAGKGVTRIVNTQDKFNKFIEARKLALEGKNMEASKIRAELGLGLQNGSGYGKGMGRNK